MDSKSNRVREIERIESRLYHDVRRIIFKHSANLSFTEVHAAIIRTVEKLGIGSAAEILKEAALLTEKYRNYPRAD